MLGTWVKGSPLVNTAPSSSIVPQFLQRVSRITLEVNNMPCGLLRIVIVFLDIPEVILWDLNVIVKVSTEDFTWRPAWTQVFVIIVDILLYLL
jgi:hypothetical protein